MTQEPDIADLERRMHGAVEALRHECAGLRTGRASTALLEPVTVDVYGSKMPLNQVSTISVPEPRLLTVQVWDKANIGAVDRAIREAGIGLNPIGEGQLLRIPIPELNEERRRELSKLAGKYAESARIAARNVRKHGMDDLKKLDKEGLGEDDHKIWADEIQEMTDRTIKEIDELFHKKEEEIMQV